MPGMGELLIILVIVVLVFGANKLPALGEGIGKAISNFKRGMNNNDDIDVTPEDKRVASKTEARSVRDQEEVRDADVVDKRS